MERGWERDGERVGEGKEEVGGERRREEGGRRREEGGDEGVRDEE